jgi:ACS family tartrate transporter-like MFS transporter
MGLDGLWGLRGWQWLFLVEGLPAILYAPVIWKLLPDSPEHVAWLKPEEKRWIATRLRADGALAHIGHEAGVLAALLSPKVWSIGLFFFFIGCCGYGFSFYMPAIFKGATGWSVSQTGWVIALFALIGAAAMLLNGIYSDHRRERAAHCIVPCLIVAAGLLVGSWTNQPWLIVAALAANFIAHYSLWGPALSVPMEFLAGRAAAAGIAAMNAIAIFSGFFGPFWMGRMKDLTGGYGAGLRGLALCALIAAGIMAGLLHNLKHSRKA